MGRQKTSPERPPDQQSLDRRYFDQVRRFWQSPAVEQALVYADIESSVAHVTMLGESGIVPLDTAQIVVRGLLQIRQEIASGETLLSPEDTDIHAGIERRLTEIVGADAAECTHLAKSHNDQIATDIRIWLKDASFDIFQKMLALRAAFLELAERDLEVIMPGYTHMQPAMPILLSHWWLANEARLRRDCARLCDSFKRLNTLPLGACQLAGTKLPIDRPLVAGLLGFQDVIENSLDAVSDRDYLIEFAAFASLTGVHMSQMSSELLLWATQEYGFVRLPRAFVFRSQSMPQKRNAELLEILRSRPSVLTGQLMEFLSQLKGLPLSYSQDLQECLPGLLNMVDNLKFILELATVLLPQLRFDRGRMRDLAEKDLTNAGNAVDFLIERGVQPEQAAKIVEAVVAYCRQRNRQLIDLTLNEWAQFSQAVNEDIYRYITIEESVDCLTSLGGTASTQVSKALSRARDVLVSDQESIPNFAVKRLNCREPEDG